MKKYLAGAAIVTAFVIGVFVLRGVGLAGYVWLAAIVVAGSLCFWKRDLVASFIRRKLAEWSNDARQLGLWISLAFKRKRDVHDTATMTHQMQFLQGRIMSPMNLFAIAFALVMFSVGGLGFQEWRINRVKAERDAECSQNEITRNRDGNFRTHRASCSALGATIEAAQGWRSRAIEAEAARIRDVARVRLETDLAVAAERERRERQAQSDIRQRRRQNEAITAALGGPSPDLDRSLCELAGGVECASTGSDPAPAGTSGPAGLPDGAGNPDATGTPVASR